MTARITNAQIMGALSEITTSLQSFDRRLGALEGNATVAAKPTTGKANTRKAKAGKASKGAKAPAKVETKVLTRSRWQELRRTKGGVVRKAFAGLTMDQALEAGLLPGYHKPTGAMRKSLSQG